MNPDIAKYKLEIAEYESEMLKLYAKLASTYQNCLDTYEKLIQAYEVEDIEIIECSKIKAINRSKVDITWVLCEASGEIISTSPVYHPSEACTIDLSKLDISPRTKLLLKAILPGKDHISKVVLEYSPLHKGTALFLLLGNASHSELDYVGTIFPIIH